MAERCYESRRVTAEKIYNTRHEAEETAWRNNGAVSGTDEKHRLVAIRQASSDKGLNFTVQVAYTMDRAIEEAHLLSQHRNQHAFVVKLPNEFYDNPDIRFLVLNPGTVSRFFPDSQDASVRTLQSVVYRAFAPEEIKMMEIRGQNQLLYGKQQRTPLDTPDHYSAFRRRIRAPLFLVK